MNEDAHDHDDTFFFIVGAPRSGTTLLQSLLNAHPDVFIPAETELFVYFESCLTDRPDHDAFDSCLRRWLASQRFRDQNIDEATLRSGLADAEPTIAGLFRTLMRLHLRSSGKSCFGEKSPFHVRYLEVIRKLLPSARFIHVMRDPRDVVASRLEVPWSSASHLAVAREWARIAALDKRYRCAIPERSYCRVFYESLVQDPTALAERLCRFLGLPFEEQMAQFPDRSGAGFGTWEDEWKGRSREPVTERRVGRYREALNARQVAGVEQVCAAEMEDLGYGVDASTRAAWWWPFADGIDLALDALRRARQSVRKRLPR